MFFFFFQGRRKYYDCFVIEVQLKNCTQFGATGVLTYMAHVKEYLQLAFFQCDNFFEISKLPTNKYLAFVTVLFSLMLRCTCSEAINKLAVTILKYRGERQVNTRVKGISHI